MECRSSIWGPTFLTLNKDPLEEYSAAQTSREVVAAMHEYVPADEEPQA